MQVRGIIATTIESKIARSGKTFYTFRLAENFGKKGDERRAEDTVWYDCVAFVDELTADLLDAKMLVDVRGRLELETFTRRNGEPGAAFKLVCFSIEPAQREQAAG